MAIQPSNITPLIGFGPDLDPMTPGVILSCDKIYPTLSGISPTQSPVLLLPALATQAYGGFRARYLDDTERIFTGTVTKLYGSNMSTLSWTDLSGASTFALVPSVTASPSPRWIFTQFGDHVITTNSIDAVQKANEGGNFAALGGSPPKAFIVVAVDNFVFLLNITNPTPQGNQWWCSGIGNDATWTPNVATQAANGLLTETQGDITAGHKLGPDLVVYKLRSMYLMQYIGPPVIWASQLISAETGVAGQESVVEMSDAHVFPGNNDFYIYNGGRPQPLKSPLREFFFLEDLDQNYMSQIVGRWDKAHGVVVWHYPSFSASPAGSLDKWIAWHPSSDRWTMGTRSIEYVIQSDVPLSVGTTYAQAGSVYTTYGDNITKTYAKAFPGPVFPGGDQGIFQTDHALYTLNGDKEDSYFITGDVGNDETFTHLTRVKPKFKSYPTTSTLTEYHKVNLGDSLTTGKTASLALQGWYNVIQSARFHRFKFSFSGDYEILGYEPILGNGGRR